MIFRNFLLPGVIVPAVTTFSVLGLCALTGGASGPWRRGVAGLSVAAGYLAAFVTISGWPSWPPVEATQRLCFLVAGVALASLVLARTGPRRAEPWIALAAIGLLVPLVLQRLLSHSWSPPQASLWIAGLLVLGSATAAALAVDLTVRDRTLLTVAVRLVVIAGIAVLLGLSDSLRLAQLAGALVCCIAVVESFGRWRAIAWCRIDALVLTVILVGLLLVGYFYAGLTDATALLAALSLLLLGLSRSPSLWLRLAPVGPLSLALALALSAYLSQTPYDPYDTYASFDAAPNETAPATESGSGGRWSGKVNAVAQ